MSHSIEILYECKDARSCSSALKALKGQDLGRADAKVEVSAHGKIFKLRITSSDIGLLRSVADSYLRYLQAIDA
ncbi:MAG: hypothetical protein QW035_00145 [Candidatus Anstonellales archaeon]